MPQHPNNQMVSGSDFYSTKPELSGLKNRGIISGVYEVKSPSDYETAWSPTSPLDFRLFSSLGNPFGGCSSRSIRKVHQKSWDSGKVGLSIVDSLDDHHTDSSRILLPSPDSRNLIFGSLMRNGNSRCQKPHQPFARTHMHNDDKPIVGLIELGSSMLVNACQVMEQTQGSLIGHTESDIEISEDYTCVISHGSNPKITHFYGDQVLESLEHNGVKKSCCGYMKESIFEIAPLDLTTFTDVLPSRDFLSFCSSCNKKLGMGKDIYMYRGYKAFCSSECRSEVIRLDENLEEEEEEEATSDSSSDKDLSEKKSNGVIFTVG
ncbi:unnamed protein product [Thlaspi arvense]|uniref:FLZ-type domain-containing protein n=1 Tax=Thlaspi arvense TaxID=13288 RepID=A0AAU9SUI8_THLAR|nr:unnamed protein product [Thlaspi arvense]